MTKDLIKSNLAEYEKLFLSLADKTRLKLLALMANGPVSVGFLVDELGESQPKVSRHLAYLRNAGVVNTKRDGKWIYYGIQQQSDDPDLERVVKFVLAILMDEAPAESTRIKTARQTQSRVDYTRREPADVKQNEVTDQVTQQVAPEVEESDGDQLGDKDFVEEVDYQRDNLEVFLL